jgi:hypothetical protein
MLSKALMNFTCLNRRQTLLRAARYVPEELCTLTGSALDGSRTASGRDDGAVRSSEARATRGTPGNGSNE